MARFVFKLPDVGEGIAEAEIVKWHVNVGEAIREEQPLVDIMTDKATVEIAAPVSGTLSARTGEEGSRLAVGAELAVIETAGEAPSRPVVGGTANIESVPRPQPSAKASGKALAAPAVRARATSLSIDLASVSGSGPGGRIEHADLDRPLQAKDAKAPPAPPLAPLEDGAEDIKIFGLRRRIAERMQDAKRRVPHFAYVEEVDVQELENLRAALNSKRDSKPHLTVLPFLIRAIVAAIARHPFVNCHFDDANGIIRRFKSVHAGIATQTERGLLVPVIHHVEAMNVWQLAAEIARLSEAARAGKSERRDLTGSTITVTSLGALGGLMATPIINPPEVAIVGVNRIAERATVIDHDIVVRKMMNLSSSFDHRIVDGHQAAAFIAEVRARLQHPLDLVTGDTA
ncbi:MAG: 2-oxo acid dehydrogenase subunit E2 [Rhizobiales bacterium]|nr:2-oxo acid dehydrogenase subunit E2 [Hyphomicrobiales bacterium]MBI3672291.1 2-oxo acid dehydrogenase subunit E2 [Hyphomicrobiales bacterium]